MGSFGFDYSPLGHAGPQNVWDPDFSLSLVSLLVSSPIVQMRP